jgi:hypothetical protein
VFSDPLARIFEDEDHDIEEQPEINHRHGTDYCWSRLFSERMSYESSAHGRRREMSGRTMKKASSRKRRTSRDDMRREYRFDYTKARPNRFAAVLKRRTTAVVLDPDVASVFESPESVNRLLRSVIAALPAGAKRKRPRG